MEFLKLATLNIQGINEITQRQTVEACMKTNKINVLGIQETKHNSNSYGKRGQFHWYFSSSVKDEDREKYEKLRNSNKPITQALKDKVFEKRGVAFVFHESIHQAVSIVHAIDGNNILAKIRATPDIFWLNTYLPHSDAGKSKTESAYGKIDEITGTCRTQKQILIISGDFNARILMEHGKPHMIGKYYIKSPHDSIHQINQHTKESRELFSEFLQKMI